MKITHVNEIDTFTDSVIPKPSKNYEKIVSTIINDVKKNGDSAILKYEQKFSGARIKSTRVSKSEIKNAYSKVTKEQVQAINFSRKKLLKIESLLKSQLRNITNNTEGIQIKKIFLPISSVGCYVPGGLANYPTSVVMSVVPAKVAGVKRIVVVSPTNRSGTMNPLTVVAADLCGTTEIYKIGGAHAIAALSFGTRSISPVDKIVGPGGPFVTTAKFLVSNRTSIDMFAGPTELGIIADNTSNESFVASDLISQAEHSNDTFCWLITTSSKFASLVNKEIEKILSNTKRKKIIQQSLRTNGIIVVCKNNNDVIKLANKLAPEHLQIMTKNARSMATKIISPGLLLIGKNTPSAASDYMLGTNHILPTNGFGKVRGSLSILDFLKLHTQVESKSYALEKISKYIQILASQEELPNHFEAVRRRLS